MVPENFIDEGATADYCDTGIWSAKAIEEGRRVGNVHVACSSAPDYTATPSAISYSAAPRYVHYTSNETIYGTQWVTPPANAPAPLVCDASSDIFSRPLALANHGLIYAGAQKNLGPSGISLVIGRKDFIDSGNRDLPPLAQYRTYAAEKSMHNTPNTFGVYIIGEVVAWIREQGGLAAMAELNTRKAKLLYDFLDASKSWRDHARSRRRARPLGSARSPLRRWSTREHLQRLPRVRCRRAREAPRRRRARDLALQALAEARQGIAVRTRSANHV
jgi:phosphoserine aminotransferase